MSAESTQLAPEDEATGPVTTTVARRVRPGREAEYERWVQGVTAAARRFPGHLGSYVLRPGPGTGHEYVIIYRFDTYAHARAWETSEERAAWVAQVEPLVEGEARRQRVTGLEFWFDLPEVPAGAQPVRYKMALTLTVVVFLLLLAINLALGPWLEPIHWIPRLLIVVALQVLLLTYVVMPRVTRLLRGWLYPG